MKNEPIDDSGKPIPQPPKVTADAVAVSSSLRNFAEKMVREGVPIDIVAAAFQTVATALSFNLNSRLIAEQAQRIAVATPEQAAAIKGR